MEQKGHIKVEYTKLVCGACLSSDRALSHVGIYWEILQSICNNTFLDDSMQLILCWECIAFLRKIKLFKEKVINAQQVLRYHYFDQENYPLNLSNLSVAEANNVSIEPVTETYVDKKHKVESETVHEIETKIEIELDTEWKHETGPELSHEIKCKTGDKLDNRLIDIKLKEEPEIDNDSNDVCDDTQNDYVYSRDFKSSADTLNIEINKPNEEKEVKEQTMRQKNRGKYYRIIPHSTNDLLRKVKIGQDELNTLREKIRNGKRFKTIKSKCYKCLTKFSTKALKKHNIAFHDKSLGEYTCDICQSYFSSKEILATHIQGHYEIFECKQCRYQCSTEDRFSIHVHRHKKTSVVQCVECSETYNSVAKFFKHHKAKHTGVVCHYCKKKCFSKFSLEKHIKNHHNQWCDICKIEFKRKHRLNYHIQLKHVKNPTEDAFCVMCNKQFDNVLRYQLHVKTSVAHLAEQKLAGVKKEFPCPECGNVYKRKSYMNTHYRVTHLGQSKYYCKEHNKLYLKGALYRQHIMYVHEGRVREKNKMCNICGRGFSTNRILTHHMRTHTGEKPYACSHCDARFAQRSAMLTHVKHIHLKESRKSSASQRAFLG